MAPKIVVDSSVLIKWFKTRLASFLALAVELDCPFITADRRLFGRARTLPRVRHLSRVGSLP